MSEAACFLTAIFIPNHDTIQSIQDENGWVTVDDMGYLDEDGYLYIVGREKNMILYGGVNVFPEEIETVLDGTSRMWKKQLSLA